MILFCSVSFLLLGLSTELKSQKLSSGPQVLTFFSDVDDTEQPYGLYLPANYDSGKKYPLVVMLHGAGSNHRLALRRVFGKSNLENENDVEASRYFPAWDPVDYIVISPYARGTAGYRGVPEKDVYDALEDAKRRFSVDEDRIYLTGLSMGGGGTLWLGLTRPDIWAAIAPVCPAPPKGTEKLIVNAFNYPVHFFHGGDDPVVPVKISRDLVDSLKSMGANVAYKEYPGVQHDSWVQAYEGGFIFDWFRKFTRNSFPDEVKFATQQYIYNSAYWVQLDELTPGTLASITAKFSEPNSLSVDTEELSGFSLHISNHPKYLKEEKLTLTIDGKKIKLNDKKDTLSFHKEKGKWIEGRAPKSATAKQKGTEGPLREAFADRHIYVYGTMDNPSGEVLSERIKIATEAANWSVYRGEFLGRYKVFPRVLSDKELKPSDFETSNLVLFGTKETNRVIADNSERLPMHLTNSENYGLLYIFPLNGKYIVVSSGLPWWRQGEQSAAFNFLPVNLAVLEDFKDFVLFEGTLENIVSEGYFNPQWKLTDEAKAKIKESGVVELK